MADFMTVLAASQKHGIAATANAKQGNPFAGLLPEGLFGSVLSAQLEVPLAVTAPALPVALTGEATTAVKPAEKEVASLIQGAPDPSAEIQATLAQATQAQATPAQIIPTQIIPTQVAQAQTNPAQTTLAPVDAPMSLATPVADARPVAKSPLVVAQPAASPAASASARGQELPPVTLAMSEADPVAAGEFTVLPAVAAEPPGDTPLPHEPASQGINLPRPLGQFDQASRAVESRVQVALEAPMRSQAFPAELSEKIVWLAGRQSQWADLSLNPPQLGALEVRLSLSGGEAGAQFFSPHPAVRDAIEAALPKLRELLAQAGITLGEAQVREEAFAHRDGQGSNPAGGELEVADSAMGGLPLAMPVRSGLGLVDLYV